MNYLNPIYTEKADCQDCYKCVRNCPVKAIRVENGSATVIYEQCILCGGCVEVCPPGAKKVRDDLPRLRQIIASGRRVILSLAPSYISVFTQTSVPQMITGLKKLGFFGISETALGAQEVSANCARLLNESQNSRIFISSACPSVVEYILKYEPSKAGYITPLLSPMLSHARMLKEFYGSDTSVVFAGPCIAKKKESDLFPELAEAVITFEDLAKWLQAEKIDLSSISPSPDAQFIPRRAFEGTLYPVEGGMNAGIRRDSSAVSSTFMSFSGIQNISRALNDLENYPLREDLFLELLACEGGCINGPKTNAHSSTVIKRLSVIDNAVLPDSPSRTEPVMDIARRFENTEMKNSHYCEDDIRKMLQTIGKTARKDELNCAGCGYNTCRDFAASLLDGKSETKQCVSYMRVLAQKKANALIQTMPSGVVIVDDKLRIVECNKIFANLMGEETMMLYDVRPGLEGAMLQKIMPSYKLFQTVLETGSDIVGKELNFNNTVLLFSIFTIEKERIVGGIFRDITEPWVRKEQVVNKAREVIKKNLSTVQKIAYLLGENAAESEVILNGIIESFSTNKIDDIEDE